MEVKKKYDKMRIIKIKIKDRKYSFEYDDDVDDGSK